MRFLIIGAFLITSGCAHLNLTQKQHVVRDRICGPIQFVAVDSFDGPEFAERVQIAVAYWNEYAGRKILSFESELDTEPVDQPKLHHVSVSIATLDDLSNWDDENGGRTRNYRTGKYPNRCISGSAVRINHSSFDMTGDRGLRIVIHELGHALGLDHSWARYTVMYFEQSDRSDLHIGRDTLDELRSLYAGENTR